MPNFIPAMEALKGYGILPNDFEKQKLTRQNFISISKQVFHFSEKMFVLDSSSVTLMEGVRILTALLDHDVTAETANALLPKLLKNISAPLNTELDALTASQLLFNAIRTTSLYNPATDWFSKARFGLMEHFLLFDDQFNNKVNQFNVDRLAKTFHELGASYFVLTVGQNSGYYCTPNHAYDRITGSAPGTKTSIRDLPMDMAEALAKYDIPLFLYSSIQAPMFDKQAYNAFGWEKQLENSQESMGLWNEVLTEWSLRYGDAVKGWWIDGCYAPDQYSDYSQKYSFKTVRDALKAGNPNAIICFNPGIGILPNSYYEDYTAGESNDFTQIPESRWIKGDQWHELCFIDRNWGGGWGGNGVYNEIIPRFSNKYMVEYLKKVNEKGGTLTIDYRANEYLCGDQIHPVFLEQLKQISRGLDGLPFEDCPGQSIYPEEAGNLMPNAFFYYPDSGMDGANVELSRSADVFQTGDHSLRCEIKAGGVKAEFNKLIDIKNKKKYILSCTAKCDGGAVGLNLYLAYWLYGLHSYVDTARMNYENNDKDNYTALTDDWIRIERLIDVDEDVQVFCTRFSVEFKSDNPAVVYIDKWSISPVED